MSRPAQPHARIDLLRAAEAVFVEHGLDQARVEEITDRAGCSKGAFYLHFESKEDAFRRIVEGTLARLAACVGDGPLFSDAVGGGLAPAELLDQWRRRDLEVFEFIWQNRRLMRLMLEGGKSAGFVHLMDEFAERTRAIMIEGMRWGRARGFFRRDLDPEVASLALAGAYDRVARQIVRLEEKPDLAALLSELQRILYQGLGATPPVPAPPGKRAAARGRAGLGRPGRTTRSR